MVAYWNSELRCEFANKAYLDWFGRRPEQVVGLHLRELLGDELFFANEPYIRGTLLGEPQKFERALTRADGSTGYTWADEYVPDIDHGRINGFFALVSDISELKHAQEGLRASEAKMPG